MSGRVVKSLQLILSDSLQNQTFNIYTLNIQCEIVLRHWTDMQNQRGILFVVKYLLWKALLEPVMLWYVHYHVQNVQLGKPPYKESFQNIC